MLNYFTWYCQRRKGGSLGPPASDTVWRGVDRKYFVKGFDVLKALPWTFLCVARHMLFCAAEPFWMFISELASSLKHRLVITNQRWFYVLESVAVLRHLFLLVRRFWIVLICISPFIHNTPFDCVGIAENALQEWHIIAV